MSQAIIVSASIRRKKEPKEPIPALERFTGVYFRIFKKHLREGKLKKTDIIIISPEKGILLARDQIAYKEPILKLRFDKSIMLKKRETNLQVLKKLFKRRKYTIIYVNVGRTMMQLIEGFETLTSAKIEYAEGPGIGPKAQHMRNWILR